MTAALRDPWRLAALGYWVYGAVYFGGAVARLGPGQKITWFGFLPWWAFFAIGAAFWWGIPALILLRKRWVACLFALGPAVKATALCWREGRKLAAGGRTSVYDVAFAAVAFVAAALLVRAAATRPAPNPDR